LISSTRVGGRYVLRMCILGHATEWEHVERVIAFLERTEVEAAPTAEVYERHPDVARSWLAGAESGAADLERLPIFRSLQPAELERLAEAAELVEAARGDTIVAQWDASKDFYVVLAGTVDVSVEGERIRALGPGEFFGELAALDWGSGFGYPRLATVAAASPVRLFVYSDGVLNRFIAELPAVGSAIRAAVAERLARG